MKNRIAILAAIALPFTMIGCSDDDPANAIPDDVQSVVDAYSASWNEYDAEAFNAVVTDDYMFINSVTGADATKAAQAGGMAMLESMSWNAEQDVGDGIAAADGPWYVAVSNTLTTTNSYAEGISVLTTVDDGGVLKVSEHIYTGTQP